MECIGGHGGDGVGGPVGMSKTVEARALKRNFSEPNNLLSEEKIPNGLKRPTFRL